jgi:RHS repeat-associated protein
LIIAPRQLTYYNAARQMLETRDTTTENDQPENLQPDYQYVWSARYIDAPVRRDQNTDQDGLCDDQRLYFLTDANVNVTTLLYTIGAPLERYQYDPYGKVTIYTADWSSTRSSSLYNNVRLFTGREYAFETGYYHYRNRYYHAELGRFLSRDPIGYEAEDMNLYLYCANNPVFVVDPRGLFTVEGPRGYRPSGGPDVSIGGRFRFHRDFGPLGDTGGYIIQDVEVTGTLVCNTSDGNYDVVGFRYSWTEVFPWHRGRGGVYDQYVDDTHLNRPRDAIAFLAKHCPKCACDLKKGWSFTSTAEFVAYNGMVSPATGAAVTPVDPSTTYRCADATDEGTTVQGKDAIMSMYPGKPRKRGDDPTAPTRLSKSTLTRLGVPGYDTDTWVCSNGTCHYTSTGYHPRRPAAR